MSDSPIIRVVLSNGDWAEADSPEAAVLAARTLWDDVSGITPGIRCAVNFYVEDDENETAIATIWDRSHLTSPRSVV